MIPEKLEIFRVCLWTTSFNSTTLKKCEQSTIVLKQIPEEAKHHVQAQTQKCLDGESGPAATIRVHPSVMALAVPHVLPWVKRPRESKGAALVASRSSGASRQQLLSSQYLAVPAPAQAIQVPSAPMI
jgi:hypothetical protein